jgi:glucokinase
MSVIGIDLGGTKLASAVFNNDGGIVHRKVAPLEGRKGREVGNLVISELSYLLGQADSLHEDIRAVGICIPGIYYVKTGCVWAPNIPEWENYPLLDEVQQSVHSKNIAVRIDSDRACYILGETWQGAAKGCTDAVFLAIGTGIGAGILCNGKIIRGHGDIAGALGWMGLHRPYREVYRTCGCFEYNASGEGMVKVAREMFLKEKEYSGYLGNTDPDVLTTRDIFSAYEKKDCIASYVVDEAIAYWGMAVANIVSTFNPEKIILGGGVFGPASEFLDRIIEEAYRWAQPISMKQVRIEISTLGGDAGLIGAGRLALMMNR